MKKEYTISVFSEHKVGLLHRITVIFSRRKINIESLNTSESEVRGIYRFTIVIQATEAMARTVTKQIEKQIGILKAFYHTVDEIVYQEIALYKVPTEAFANGDEVESLIRQHNARIRRDTRRRPGSCFVPWSPMGSCSLPGLDGLPSPSR